MSGFISSSIARKVAMALSALFLIFFLIIHLSVNLTSVFSESLFNELSHFMGTNPLVQFALQPVLIFGSCFSFCDGFCVRIEKQKSFYSKICQKQRSGKFELVFKKHDLQRTCYFGFYRANISLISGFQN